MGSMAGATDGPPAPTGVSSYDDLAERLRELRAASGLSYRELHRRVLALRRSRGVAELPSADTVHRCLQPGRRRLDVELVVDIVRVLAADGTDTTPWRQACAAAAGQATEAAVVSVADSLPEDTADFVGRKHHLTDLLARVESDDRARPLVVDLDGMPGVGKTRLAIRAGRSIIDAGHCDLVLWVNLRGHDPHRPPAAASSVLDGFLRRLGVPGSRTGALDLEERASRYRALVRSRRPLVVLDDAASEQQVRPLLPDSPHSVTLITSRSYLGGVDPDRMSVPSFDDRESIAMLAGVVGEERVTAEPDAAAGIVAMVGHLPLGIGIEGARILQAGDWTLADHLARLRHRHSRLLLTDGVELALGSSYDALPPDTRRLFRLIGLHPGEDLDGYAAAALADVDPDTATALLRTLLDANLLRPGARTRYVLHDLVRLFAANRVADHESRTAQRQALARLRDYYRYTAMLAMDRYAPDVAQRPRFDDPGRATPEFPDHGTAREWLDTERSNLVAVAADAADDPADPADPESPASPANPGGLEHSGGAEQPGGSSTVPIDLSETLYRYLDFTASHSEALVLHRIACATTSGPRRGHALRFLGVTKEELGSYDEALDLFRRSAAIHREFGDVVAEASALCNSGITNFKCGRQTEAVRLLERARELYRSTDNRAGEAIVLGNLGTIYGKWNRPTEALECCREALRLARELEFRGLEAFVLGMIGSVHASRDEHPEALRQYHRAIEIAEEMGTHTLVSTVNNKIGLSHRALGDPGTAGSFHRAALTATEATGELAEQAVAYEGLADCADDLDEPAEARDFRQRARAIRLDLGLVEPSGPDDPDGSTPAGGTRSAVRDND